MDKWADYLISQVTYNSNHLISKAVRHEDSEDGINKAKIIDRLTIASDIKHGLTYLTVYDGLLSWKRGHKIHAFQINGQPFLRIDENKVPLDNLGDLPEVSHSNSTSPSESIEEEATPEQLTRLKQLEKQIQELESQHENQQFSHRSLLPQDTTNLSQELDIIPESIDEEITIEYKLIQTLQQQNQKLADIKNNLRKISSSTLDG